MQPFPHDANTNYDRFCGNFLNLDPTSSAIVTIYTNLVPYVLGVVMDGYEVDTRPGSSTEYSKGFSIYYSQTAC